MAQERFLPSIPVTRQVELQQLIRDVESPPIDLSAPSEEQAPALDQVFAAEKEERNPLVDGLSLAAAGMLFHDLVKDTLHESDDEEEEQPAAKPPEPDPEVD